MKGQELDSGQSPVTLTTTLVYPMMIPHLIQVGLLLLLTITEMRYNNNNNNNNNTVI